MARIKKEQRLGMSNMMRCGMNATIVRYGNSHDIDVKFEDGYIAKGKGYDEFIKGRIGNPNHHRNLRVGEKRLMKCGMMATIIRYGGSHDIDVLFENGFVSKSKVYDDFIKGRIGNKNRFFNERVGETRKMKCGMHATIIRYGNALNIDVKFEDGFIAKNKQYHRFKNGTIGHPWRRTRQYYENLRVGETRRMNCGMMATIIRYSRFLDIDVKFEDGTIVKNKNYYNFCKRSIGNPSLYKKNRQKGVTTMESVRKTIHECEEGKLIECNGDYEILVMSTVNEDGIVSQELQLMATFYAIGYVRNSLGKMYNLFTKDAAEIRSLAIRQYEKLTGATVG